MPTECDIILSWDATPGELRAVGTALWRWCTGTGAAGDVFQRLDSQALADLVAGVVPSANRTRRFDGWGVHFSVCEESGLDRRATVDGLRRALPRAGIVDVLVGGTSWHRVAAEAPGGPEQGAHPAPAFS